MQTTKTTKELHAEAREVVAKARANYNATWRKDPTARGYPAVDKALAALNTAEAEERRLAELVR